MPEELNVPQIDVEGTIRAAGEHSEEIHNTIKRNTDHLEIVLAKDEVKASNSPRLADFQEAVDLGVEFIAE